MKNLSIENFGMMPLSSSEALEISGGHEGWAFELGTLLGKTIKVVGEVAAVVVFILVPKS
jgi:hypothetical protein